MTPATGQRYRNGRVFWVEDVNLQKSAVFCENLHFGGPICRPKSIPEARPSLLFELHKRERESWAYHDEHDNAHSLVMSDVIVRSKCACNMHTESL